MENENKKYRLTEEIKEIDGHLLHRIECVTPFRVGSIGIWINKGSLGGWIEKEYNLSQEGGCWVDGEAMVYDEARIFRDAYVHGEARVYGNASVSINARVCGHVAIYGRAYVTDNAVVSENATICERAAVYDFGSVYGNATVYGNAIVTDHALVFGSAKVHEHAIIEGYARIIDQAEVYGSVDISDFASITLSAVVKSMGDFLFLRNNFSSGRGITWTKSNDTYQTGCFHGTADELIAKAKEDDELRKKHSVGDIFNKADYFRAIVAMVERFKELNVETEKLSEKYKI